MSLVMTVAQDLAHLVERSEFGPEAVRKGSGRRLEAFGGSSLPPQLPRLGSTVAQNAHSHQHWNGIVEPSSNKMVHLGYARLRAHKSMHTSVSALAHTNVQNKGSALRKVQ